MLRILSLHVIVFFLWCHISVAETGIVQKVVDGDTVWLRIGNTSYRTRLLCVDSLEKLYNPKLERDTERLSQSASKMMIGGEKAYQVLKALVPIGQRVTVEIEKEKFDSYGRLLAYMYLPTGENINLELVKKGYAGVLCYHPNDKQAEKFIAALTEAKRDNRGLWGEGYVLPERWVR